MVIVETSRVRTVAMNNTDNDVVINIVQSSDFKKFIKELYSDKDISAYQIASDICLAMNETQTGAFIAEPIDNGNKVTIKLCNNSEIDFCNGDNDALSVSPTDNYYEIVNYIDDMYIKDLNSKNVL